MMKNWKRITAALLAALMLAGCGSVSDTIDTVNAVADAIDEATGYGTTEDAAADAADADDGVTIEADGAEITVAPSDESAKEAVASRPDDDADAVDPAFTVEADTEGIDDGMIAGDDGKTVEVEPDDAPAATDDGVAILDEDAYYYDKDNVALYIVTYHKLPSNYITKKEAQALGWEGGPLEPYAPDMAIGGDHFGNYEGLLPEDADYHECDIDTKGKKRGAKRIIYSDDWAVYYTDDHYETFTQLY